MHWTRCSFVAFVFMVLGTGNNSDTDNRTYVCASLMTLVVILYLLRRYDT